MRSFVACNIPDRQSLVQIGFDQISPSAPPIKSFRFETSTSTRFNLKFLRVFWKKEKKKTPWKASFYFFCSPKKLVRLYILKDVKPSPDSKMIKLVTFNNLFPPTTTFSLKLVVELFPAKITLVHEWAPRSIEKILYSNSSSSQNIKLSNNRSGYDITFSAPQWPQLHSRLKRSRLECQTKGLRLNFINSALEWQASIRVFTVTDYFVVAYCRYVYFLSLRVRRVVDN